MISNDENGVRWRKSSHSYANHNCGEVGSAEGSVLVRDSRLGDHSPVLTFGRTAWTAFTAGLKREPPPSSLLA